MACVVRVCTCMPPIEPAIISRLLPCFAVRWAHSAQLAGALSGICLKPASLIHISRLIYI